MAIGDPYNTRDAFKLALDITSDEEDAWIDLCLLGAARALERRSGWPTFWNTETAVARSVPLLGKVVPVRRSGFSYDKVLLREGIASRTGVLVNGSSNVTLMPEDAIDDGTPADAFRVGAGVASSGTGFLTVTAVWGWPEVPSDVTWAHQMQSHRFYGRKGSPEGVAGSAEWGLTRIPALDPDVLSILKGGGYLRAGIG